MNNEKIHHWKKIADEFSSSQSRDSDQVFCISFLEDPGQEIKQKLKDQKFTWNRFRKEYYGKGKRSDIENILKVSKFNLEEIIK